MLQQPNKKKILVISDHQLSTSGVGISANLLIRGLLDKGTYTFRTLAGAIRHEKMDTIVVNADYILKPVEGFGNRDQIRHLLVTERPDAMLIITDPRFFYWLWEMEDEIHQVCPIAYWHVWDNDPYPEFNNVWYESTDLINCISWKTFELIKPNFPEKTNYIPHAFPKNMYFPATPDQIEIVRKQNFGDKADWFMALWVNRNATRKMPNDVLMAWKMFLDDLEQKHGHRNASLVMHTDPGDQEGPNLVAVMKLLGLENHVLFSTNKIDFNHMNVLHNITDVTINIAKAEGFGLCVKSDTLVETKQGFKEIIDVNVGDMVFGSDGDFHKVLAKSSRTEKNVIKMKPLGCPAITSSKEHPFLVAKKISEGNYEQNWVEAKDISKGDLLCVKKPNDICLNETNESKTIDILDWIKPTDIETNDEFVWKTMGYSPYSEGLSISGIQKELGITKHRAEGIRTFILKNKVGKKHNLAKTKKLAEKFSGRKINNKVSMVKRSIHLDEEFFHFMGWYLAEGSNIGGSGIEINLHKNEVGIAEWANEYLEKTFGIKGISRTVPNTNKSVYWGSSKIVAQFFAELCGNHAKFKRIHPEILANLSREQAGSLLKGLFLGDGHHRTKKPTSPYWAHTTISLELANQVRNILLKFGIYSSFSGRFPKMSKNRVYDTRIQGKEYHKFCKFIDVEAAGNQSKKLSRSIHWNDWVLVPVNKISSTVEEQTLFDIQVEGSQNFSANGVIIHNSSLCSLQCGKPNISLKTGGLTRQIVDYRDGTELGVALEPVERCLIGGQTTPYIFEDIVSKKELSAAFMKIYEYTPEQKEFIKAKALNYVNHEFNFEKVITDWDTSLTGLINTWHKNKPSAKRWSFVPLNEDVLATEALRKNQPR